MHKTTLANVVICRVEVLFSVTLFKYFPFFVLDPMSFSITTPDAECHYSYCFMLSVVSLSVNPIRTNNIRTKVVRTKAIRTNVSRKQVIRTNVSRKVFSKEH